MQISSSYSMNGVPYETGSVYFRPSTGICSEKHRGSEGLHEKREFYVAFLERLEKL